MRNDLLQLIAAQVALGFLRSDEMPAVAARALSEGFDSPSLRILAGLTRADYREADAVCRRALRELAIVVPGKRDAVLTLAREIAKEIVSESISPFKGAKRIAELSLHGPGGHVSELDGFVYAASELEERPEDRAVFEKGIADSAEELLRCTEPGGDSHP